MLDQTRYHLQAAERALMILQERSAKAQDMSLRDKLVSFASVHRMAMTLCSEIIMQFMNSSLWFDQKQPQMTKKMIFSSS